MGKNFIIPQQGNECYLVVLDICIFNCRNTEVFWFGINIKTFILN
jgi:hypothetical protein